MLVLSSIDLNENPQDVNLNWAKFHIHVHDLPLSKMSKEITIFIWNHLGIFVDVDMDTADYVWGSHIRIRISIDVTKPLKRLLKLRTTLGDEQLLSFMYEKLLNFCYLCGCLGHLSKFCELRFSEDFIDLRDATPFRPWLRATNPPLAIIVVLQVPRTCLLLTFHPPLKNILLALLLEYPLIPSIGGFPSLVLFHPLLLHHPQSLHNLIVIPLDQLLLPPQLSYT
ncbi:UNVERIFIED_CONTAM: hypothetical protein Sradi_4874400 [Sesamum radiatum]|uniref:Zinc knuckle CX2CX4HX4C domain-containing protein n=1 Tax=Sesamum radiatum TaxID=300843 RepID=A0AAW2N167_SESRA